MAGSVSQVKNKPEHLSLDLDSEAGAQLLAAVVALHGPLIAKGARVLQRMFLLRSPWAPGLRFVGGEVSPPRSGDYAEQFEHLSIAGSGRTIEDAFAACVGEAIERLSQFEQPGDVAIRAQWCDIGGDALPGLDDLIANATALLDDPDTPLDWIRGVRLADAAPVLVPADWCVRRPASARTLEPRTALSTGTAAGPSYEAAASRALLELVERHAVFMWWEGGRRAAPLPLEHVAMRRAHEVLVDLRQSVDARPTWLLDITTELGVPAIAAVSFDRDGKGFACGTAARVTPEAAVSAAIGEMCQMELGLMIAKLRQAENGGKALNETDVGHLDRARRIDANACALVHPLGSSVDHSVCSATDDLCHLRSLFADHGIEASFVNLTRSPFKLPVVHALAPGLCPFPAWLQTSGTLGASRRFGGAERWTDGVALV